MKFKIKFYKNAKKTEKGISKAASLKWEVYGILYPPINRPSFELVLEDGIFLHIIPWGTRLAKKLDTGYIVVYKKETDGSIHTS
jgi:hypothetical protein